MQRRTNEFTLEPINNVLQGSVFGRSNVVPKPVVSNFKFLLMNGGNFKLMTGSNLLLVS